MKGCARAPGAGTILNALANGYGSAFAIDIYTTAEVVLQDVEKVTKNIIESLSILISKDLDLFSSKINQK